MWYKNIAGRFFRLATKHACDRRTDGQNYDSQDRSSIAASRDKILLLGLAAEFRSRRWMWSTLPPAVRSLWHSPANKVDSARDDQPFQGYGCAGQNFNGSRDLTIRPFQGCLTIHGLAIATDSLPTKFEVSISTHYEYMKDDTKCWKWGGLG